MSSLLQGEVWVANLVAVTLEGKAKQRSAMQQHNAYVMAVGNIPVEIGTAGSDPLVCVPAMLADSQCFMQAALTEEALEQLDVRVTESWDP